MLEVLPVLARLGPQELKRLVSLKRSTVDSGNDSSESGVVMKVAQPVRDVDELLNLPRAALGLIVAEDQRHDPA